MELNLDSTRIRKWCYVQSNLAEIWAIEDGIDPSYFRQLTEIFERMI